MDNGASSYRRFLDGEESAFDDIIKELFHSLVFFINRYVHNIHTAEDIAIDVFADLGIHRHKYNFKVSLKTYLFMIGKSRALNYLKRQKAVEYIELTEVENTLSDEIALEEIVLNNERKRIINAAISKLPDDMRTAIHLVYFENMTYDEAAKVMKKNQKQIDNLLYRAKKELRTILGKKGEILL